MKGLILALSVPAMAAVCVPAFAQEFVPSVPGDGMPDFYYFDVDAAMPDGAIYAGEVFPAGSFVIDPEGPDFGLITVIVQGPPALGFDDNPNPGHVDSPRHVNAGSIITQFRWISVTGRYVDRLPDPVSPPPRDWVVGYIAGRQQVGIVSGRPLMGSQWNGEYYEYKGVLTKALIYEGGLGNQFGIVTFANYLGLEVNTPVTVIPEPGTLTMLVFGVLCLAVHVRCRRRHPYRQQRQS